MLVDGYIRVSQVGGRTGASFISPDLQRERIIKWCALSGATLAAVHVELDESGANPDRPLLKHVLDRIEAGETQGVVVARMDRFGRSLLHSLQAIERIDRAGGTFVSVDDGLDLTTSTGRLVVRIMLSLAEFELDRIRDNWRDSGRKAIERGVHFGSIPPTGYRRRPDGRLHPDPAVAPYIAEAFRRRAAGQTQWTICRWLESEHVLTSRGGTGWTTSTIGQIIANTVYMGVAHRGEFTRADAHPAIVDSALWHRAQLPRQPGGGGIRHNELFKGYLRCAGCRLNLQTNRTKGHKYWVCDRRNAFGRCPTPASISAEKLEAFVIIALKRRLSSLARHDAAQTLAAAQARLAEAEASVDRYRDNDRLEATLGPDRYTAGLTTRMDRVQRAALEIAAARDTDDTQRDAGLDWDTLSPVERRDLIARQLDCVFVAHSNLPVNDRTFICWRNEAPTDLPLRGAGAKALRAFDPDRCLGRAAHRRRPRAFQPRWPEARLQDELTRFVTPLGYMPDKRVFVDRDALDLYAETALTGGRSAWARRLGIPLKRIGTSSRPRSLDELELELRIYVGDRPTLPSYSEFRDDGQRSLWHACVRRGGLDHWASALGVVRAPSQQHRSR